MESFQLVSAGTVTLAIGTPCLRNKITLVGGTTTLLKKGELNQHTFYVQKTTHLKVCYSSTPLGVL
jgi:hypothetical protein